MLGRTHRELETIEPLQDGVIADFKKMTDDMIQGFIRKNKSQPTCSTKDGYLRSFWCYRSRTERGEGLGRKGKCQRNILIEEPVAAAIGIGLDK